VTLYEQVEELTRRVGELEASHAELNRHVVESVGWRLMALDKRAPKGIPVIEPVMKPIGALEAIGDDENLRRVIARGERDYAIARHGIDTQARMSSDPEHARQMAIASMLKPQPPYEVRMLAEAVQVLEHWVAFRTIGGSPPLGWTNDFLGRARVATQEP
jgi:hypothetical protein